MGNCDSDLSRKVIKIAKEGNVKSMRKILDESRFTPNVEDLYGQTILMLTIYCNKKHGYEITKELLHRGALVNIESKDGMTALMNAITFYRYDICMELLNKGANIHLLSHEGSSPLIHASFVGFTRMVEKLITMGVDVNYGRKRDNKSALYAALDYRRSESHYNEYRSKETDNEYNLSKVVDILLANKADVNRRLRDGSTPLFLDLSVLRIEKLLKHGADVNLINNDGLTAYDYAMKHDFYWRTPSAYQLLKPTEKFYG